MTEAKIESAENDLMKSTQPQQKMLPTIRHNSDPLRCLVFAGRIRPA
jgi:hypothetical protein